MLTVRRYNRVYKLRGEFKFKHPQFKYLIGFWFSVCVIKLWNRLGLEIMQCPSMIFTAYMNVWMCMLKVSWLLLLHSCGHRHLWSPATTLRFPRFPGSTHHGPHLCSPHYPHVFHLSWCGTYTLWSPSVLVYSYVHVSLWANYYTNILKAFRASVLLQLPEPGTQRWIYVYLSVYIHVCYRNNVSL